MMMRANDVLQALLSLITQLLPLVGQAVGDELTDPDKAEELAGAALEAVNGMDPTPDDGLIPVVVNGVDIFDPMVELYLTRALGRVMANVASARKAGRYEGTRKARASRWAERLRRLTGAAAPE